MTKFRIFILGLILSFLASCTTTPEQRASIDEMERRVAISGAKRSVSLVNLLVPECIKNLQNLAIDERKLINAGFKKDKALLDVHPHYEKLYSPSGFAKYRDADVIAPNSNGGCTISTKLRNTNDFSQPIADLMIAQSFQRLETGGGVFGKAPRYIKDDLKIEFTTSHNRDLQLTYLFVKKFR